MLQSQERNTSSSGVKLSGSTSNHSGKPPGFRTSVGHIQSTSEKELNIIRDLQRGKSFDEARTAVQKQIERIFNNNNQNGGNGNNHGSTNGPQFGASLAPKHGMHGVSHALPGELDDDIRPPPIHYGINQAIRSGNHPMGRNMNGGMNMSSSPDLSSIRHQNRTAADQSTAQFPFAPSTANNNRRLVMSHESLLDNGADDLQNIGSSINSPFAQVSTALGSASSSSRLTALQQQGGGSGGNV